MRSDARFKGAATAALFFLPPSPPPSSSYLRWQSFENSRGARGRVLATAKDFLRELFGSLPALARHIRLSPLSRTLSPFSLSVSLSLEKLSSSTSSRKIGTVAINRRAVACISAERLMCTSGKFLECVGAFSRNVRNVFATCRFSQCRRVTGFGKKMVVILRNFKPFGK